MYNDKYINTKIKIYNNKVYKNFQHNKIPKDNEYCTCLSVVLLDSILVNSNKEYCPQIFLEECKYAIKNTKILNTIKKDLELRESDDESEEWIIRPYFKKYFVDLIICAIFGYALINL